MAYLGSPSQTRAVLERHNFSIQKKYGQNFLIDKHILEQIIDAAEITEDDFVLEIGPGIGTMTQMLCERAKEVAAVEIDDCLIPVLQDTLSEYDNVSIIHEDILKVDLRELVRQKNGGRPIKVVANLPYYITTPIIMELLEGGIPAVSVTVMVQKEVARRMLEGPGSKEYGALSLAVQYYTKPELVTTVSPECFLPKPKVESAVIRLTLYDQPVVKVHNEKLLFQIIRASFNQRRKTLVNGLYNGGVLSLSKEKIAACILALGLPETVRGEALSLEEFARLADLMGEA